MTTQHLTTAPHGSTVSQPKTATLPALRLITCGSVDDGKSTLIGRLLLDSKAVLQDQLSSVQRHGSTDLALLTDGLVAEREQGITIDVAYRYFSTPARKFILGDSPGHEQYTRNMVTAASSADAAVVLVDATKLDWRPPTGDDTAPVALLPQTRRHTLLLQLLRVPSVVFAVNKLDAVGTPQDSAMAFARIAAALQLFAQQAGLQVAATLPVSALHGWNVVASAEEPGWCGYHGPTLLSLLEQLPNLPSEASLPAAFPVQWVEKPSAQNGGRRVLWGRVATGSLQPGQWLQLQGTQSTGAGPTAAVQVVELLDAVRQPVGRTGAAPGAAAVPAGQSAGVVLDREVDVSRGDWLLDAQHPPTSKRTSLCTLTATLAWLDDEALVPGRTYWVLHGHRCVKAKVQRVLHRIHIQTLAQEAAQALEANHIGLVELVLQEALPVLPYAQSRSRGALVLVDAASHRTAGAAWVQDGGQA